MVGNEPNDQLINCLPGDQDHTESKLRAGQNLHEHTPHNSGEKGPASIEDKAVSTGDTSPETKDESGKTEIKSPGTEVKPAAAVLKSAIAEGKSADTDGRNAAATKDSSSNVDQPTDSEGDEVCVFVFGSLCVSDVFRSVCV